MPEMATKARGLEVQKRVQTGMPYGIRRGAAMKLGWVLLTAFLCPLSASLWAQTNKALPSNTSGWIDILPDEAFKSWTRVAIPPDKALDPVSQWKKALTLAGQRRIG
jgi:hypothetical protein